MGLFSKKIEIKSPIKGKLVDVTEVKDEAFSTKALGDGMAMSHARPEDGVIKNGITLLKIRDGVDFDEKNRVFLLFTLAAENNEHHQELLEEIADLLNESEKIKRIMYDDLSDLEIYDLI